jgi:hypothetical protein
MAGLLGNAWKTVLNLIPYSWITIPQLKEKIILGQD